MAKIISQWSDTVRPFWINQFATRCVALRRTPGPIQFNWGQFCFCCTQLTLSVLSPGTGCAPIYMLTTPKYTASVYQASLVISRASCLLVSKTLPSGWEPTDYSWTQPRPQSWLRSTVVGCGALWCIVVKRVTLGKRRTDGQRQGVGGRSTWSVVDCNWTEVDGGLDRHCLWRHSAYCNAVQHVAYCQQ